MCSNSISRIICTKLLPIQELASKIDDMLSCKYVKQSKPCSAGDYLKDGMEELADVLHCPNLLKYTAQFLASHLSQYSSLGKKRVAHACAIPTDYVFVKMFIQETIFRCLKNYPDTKDIHLSSSSPALFYNGSWGVDWSLSHLSK